MYLKSQYDSLTWFHTHEISQVEPTATIHDGLDDIAQASFHNDPDHVPYSAKSNPGEERQVGKDTAARKMFFILRLFIDKSFPYFGYA